MASNDKRGKALQAKRTIIAKRRENELDGELSLKFLTRAIKDPTNSVRIVPHPDDGQPGGIAAYEISKYSQLLHDLRTEFYSI